MSSPNESPFPSDAQCHEEVIAELQVKPMAHCQPNQQGQAVSGPVIATLTEWIAACEQSQHGRPPDIRSSISGDRLTIGWLRGPIVEVWPGRPIIEGRCAAQVNEWHRFAGPPTIAVYIMSPAELRAELDKPRWKK